MYVQTHMFTDGTRSLCVNAAPDQKHEAQTVFPEVIETEKFEAHSSCGLCNQMSVSARAQGRHAGRIGHEP